MSGIKAFLLAVLDEFKTLIFLSHLSIPIRLFLEQYQKRNNSAEKSKLKYEHKKQTSQSGIFPKDRNSIFHSGWLQGVVVTLAVLFMGGIIGAFVIMKNPAVIVVGSAIGLTVIIWGLVVLWFVETYRPKEEKTVQFDARIVRNPGDALPYPTNLSIGGITFDSSDADVRFTIRPITDSIKNLDFRIGFDRGGSPTVIFDMGQNGQYPGVNFFPPEIPKLAIEAIPEGGTSSNFVPIDPGMAGFGTIKPFGPVWRVRCAEVFHDSTLELVLKVGFSPGKTRPTNWSPTVVEAWGSFDVEGSNGLHKVPFHIGKMLREEKSK